ncbi:MAG: NFACT family protein, partial [Armatimonadota bacterium]|nr:NFACT family protein [Armatimonadota bacterium]
MLFDSLILASVTEELGRTIVGGKVEKVTQPTPLEIVLRVYHVGKTHYLLLSADAQLARAHLTQIRRENPPTPPAFCSLLRKHLEGAWVDAVSLPLGFGERVLHIEFRANDGAPLTLIAETMGRLSNIILVSGTGTVLGAAKHIGRDLNRFRQTLPGQPYVAPPRQRQPNRETKRDPLAPPLLGAGGDASEGEALTP